MDQMNSIPGPGRAASSPMFNQHLAQAQNQQQAQQLQQQVAGAPRLDNPHMEARPDELSVRRKPNEPVQEGDNYTTDPIDEHSATRDEVPGMLRRPEVGTVTSAGVMGAHRMDSQGQALYNHLQMQGANIDPSELRASPSAEEAYMEGGYSPAPGGKPVDFESPMATDAQWGDESQNPGAMARAEQMAAALDHPVAKALIGEKKHAALKTLLSMMHKKDQ